MKDRISMVYLQYGQIDLKRVSHATVKLASQVGALLVSGPQDQDRCRFNNVRAQAINRGALKTWSVENSRI